MYLCVVQISQSAITAPASYTCYTKMSGKTAILTPDAPAPMPLLSQGVVCNGMVYVSGSLGIIPSTGKFVEGTVADRTVGNIFLHLL